jgi:hypothetical protein
LVALPPGSYSTPHQKSRELSRAGLMPKEIAGPARRQSRDAARRRPSSRCVDQRGVLLWHELGCASGADGAARTRLPIASFVPASKRTALVVSWGSEHLADWPPGFRCGRSSTATSSDVTRRPPSRQSRSTTWRVLAGTRLTLAAAWDEREQPRRRPAVAGARHLVFVRSGSAAHHDRLAGEPPEFMLAVW